MVGLQTLLACRLVVDGLINPAVLVWLFGVALAMCKPAIDP